MKLNLKKKDRKHIFSALTKAILSIFIFICLVVIVYIGIKPYHSNFREGDISDRDMYAPLDFKYKDTIDEKATEKLRQETLRDISPVYLFDSSKLVNAEEGVTSFFQNLREARKTQEIFGDDEKIDTLRSKIPYELSDAALLAFVRSKENDKAEAVIKKLVYEIADRGILKPSEGDKLSGTKSTKTVIVYDPVSETSEEIDVNTILTIDKAKEIANKELTAEFTRDRKLKKAVVELVPMFLISNLELDVDKTQNMKKKPLVQLSLFITKS